jgi:hypothetical protein
VPDPGQAWIEAIAAGRNAEAEELSTGSAGRFSHYVKVAESLEPGSFDFEVTDEKVSEGRVEWQYTDGSSIAYSNTKVDADGLVFDFDRNDVPISEYVPDVTSTPGETGNVTAVIVVVFHRPTPDSGTRTSLVVEIDNRSSEEVYGFGAVLVGSDRRSAEVVYSSSDYPPDAISDDVLVFNGIDLTDGGELRIEVDFDTTLVVEVPAVPPVEAPT